MRCLATSLVLLAALASSNVSAVSTPRDDKGPITHTTRNDVNTQWLPNPRGADPDCDCRCLYALRWDCEHQFPSDCNREKKCEKISNWPCGCKQDVVCCKNGWTCFGKGCCAKRPRGEIPKPPACKRPKHPNIEGDGGKRCAIPGFP